jgi:hypothetical protein
MPHARIDMHRTLQPKMREMSAAILKGMVDGFDMQPEDLFQIFRLHEPGELVFSRTHPDANRTDIVFIEILATPRYSDETMQHALAAIAEELSKIGIKRDNVVLVVTDAKAWHAPAEAWSGQR